MKAKARGGRYGLAGALAAAGLLAAALSGGAGTEDNGTFRFLTESLPDGSTNAEYVARVLTANADGPVTFGATGLPTGMAMDTQSGFLTGRPTATFNADITITATDGTTDLDQQVHLKVNASGGGGNAGATFDVGTLPDGEVGEAYVTTLTVTNGVGPYTFGAVDLPPGITLDGPTGVLSGTPLAPGSFFTRLSVYDAGENNKVVKVVPLRILPADSTFQFTTRFLNNGEAGTPYFDLWQTTGGSGTVVFGASGLPAGLSLDTATGEVSGAPTTPGTYAVVLGATDADVTVTTNLSMVIAPSAASSFYWDFFGIPTGFVTVPFGRQPPILVAAQNGTTVTYAAVGLPSGLTYGATTGEISGTPLEVGEYPVTFTATDSSTGEVLTLSMDLIVLPPYGGDASSITTNFWVSRAVLKSGDPGRDSWIGKAWFNADRRAAGRFDPATDAVRLEIGALGFEVPAGSFGGTAKNHSFRTPRGETPARAVKLSLVKQTLQWSSKADTIAETVPATLRNTGILGGRGYRLDEAFDARGIFKPALALRRTAFVVVKGKLKAPGGGRDAIALAGYLGDPNMAFEPGTTTLRVRALDGATVLFDRDFTDLGTGSTVVDAATGTPWHKIKASRDPATTDRVAKFAFVGNKGKFSLSLTGLALVGVPSGEIHLGIELTVGDRIYYTAVTFFESAPGSFTTTMPL